MFSGHKIYQEDLQRILRQMLPWEKLRGKKILLTGASGMLGTLLADVLMRQDEAMGLHLTLYAAGRDEAKAKERFSAYWDKTAFHFLRMDVNKPIAFSEPVDFILHAASHTHPKQYASDPVGSMTTSLFGLYHLLEYARRVRAARVVFFSSVEIYGQAWKADDVFDETYCGFMDCHTARAAYPEGKRAGEALCCAYRSAYGLDIVVPRFSRLYGPTMRLDDSKAMSQFLLNGVRGEDIVLKSEGRQRYSYCYAADAVCGLLYIWLKGESGGVYNIAGTDAPMTLREIAEEIARLTGRRVVFDLPSGEEKRGFSVVTNGVMSSARLRTLGWDAAVSLPEGIRRTLEVLRIKA